MEVSVVILTYNSELKKIYRTIDSILCQEEINFEIVISDDGSDCNHFNKIEKYFLGVGYSKYKFIDNNTNNGIVKNCLIGSIEATGEYLFITSPGDLLYDKHVLRDFYNYSKKNHSKICFGDYVYYTAKDGNIVIYDDLALAPNVVSIYNSSLKNYRISYTFSGNICGASIFRERIYAIKTFEIISKYAKYMEDNTSIAFALAEKTPVHYYNRNIVWYEYASGISTKDEKWNKILMEDYCNVYRQLLCKYPKDKILTMRCELLSSQNTKRTKLKFLFTHPIISIKRIIFSFYSKRVISYDNNDLLCLKKYINNNL